MGNESNADLMSVELPLPFVHGLLALAHLMDNRVTASLRSALEEHQRESTAPEPETPPLASSAERARLLPQNTNLVTEILGERVSGNTLPDLFARCVDVIHELDPLLSKDSHAKKPMLGDMLHVEGKMFT